MFRSQGKPRPPLAHQHTIYERGNYAVIISSRTGWRPVPGTSNRQSTPALCSRSRWLGQLVAGGKRLNGELGLQQRDRQWRDLPPVKSGGLSPSQPSAPDAASLRVTNAITLEAWVNPSVVSGRTPRTILSKFDYPNQPWHPERLSPGDHEQRPVVLHRQRHRLRAQQTPRS